MEIKALLLRHHQVFKAVLFSPRFRGRYAENIQKEVLIITGYIHGNEFEFAPPEVKSAIINETKEFIVDELFNHYLEHEHHKKFNAAYSISTWITIYICRNIKNLRRKYRPRSRDEYIAKNTDIYEERNKNFRASYDEYQDWLNMAGSTDTPEAILAAKQLFHMMLAFFGELSTQVLLGMISRQDAIVANNLNYDQYAKQLTLRRNLFIKLLYNINYLPI